MSNDVAECGCEGHVSNFESCGYPALKAELELLKAALARTQRERDEAREHCGAWKRACDAATDRLEKHEDIGFNEGVEAAAKLVDAPMGGYAEIAEAIRDLRLESKPAEPVCANCGTVEHWGLCRDALDARKLDPTEIERASAAVHDAYLVTCARLGWSVKPSNQVPYASLSEDSKELDRASVRAVLAALRREPKPATEPNCPHAGTMGIKDCVHCSPTPEAVKLAIEALRDKAVFIIDRAKSFSDDAMADSSIRSDFQREVFLLALAALRGGK